MEKVASNKFAFVVGQKALRLIDGDSSVNWMGIIATKEIFVAIAAKERPSDVGKVIEEYKREKSGKWFFTRLS